MQTCGGIDMQVETDNYRPRQVFYHHNLHTNCAQAKAVSWMLLFATASRTAQLRCPHGILHRACHISSLRQNVNSQSRLFMWWQVWKSIGCPNVYVMWHILGGRITLPCKEWSGNGSDRSVERLDTNWAVRFQFSVFGMGVRIISSPSWTSKFWSTSIHLMGTADSSPDDKGG